jgi:hypothetical protein
MELRSKVLVSALGYPVSPGARYKISQSRALVKEGLATVSSKPC